MSLSAVSPPAHWTAAPLWAMFRRIKDVEHPGEQMLSVYRDHGVVVKDDRTDNFNKTAENRNIYQLVDKGWLIVNRMKAWQGSLGISFHRGIVSGHYLCFAPEHESEPRFLNHLLRSSVYTNELRQISRGVRPNQAEIDNDLLRTLPVLLPPLAEQRAIADYLDGETARIDALIAKKQQLIHLLEERANAELLGSVGDWRRTGSRTLRQYGTTVLTGPFGTVLAASEYVEGGIPLINPTHIKDGEIRPERGVSVTPEVAERIGRHKLRTGDLVMGRKGDVGRSALVEESEAGYICGSDSIAIRCASGLDPRYLAAALRSPLYRQQLERSSTGAMVLSVNEGILLELRLPQRNLESQHRAVVAAEGTLAASREGKHLLKRQIGLLTERRQALITAAVTGEFKVPGAV